MFLYMVRLRRKNFKITHRIVEFIAVLMMHDLKRSELAIKMALHDKSMLIHLFPVSVPYTSIALEDVSCASGCAMTVSRTKLSCGASGSKTIETQGAFVEKGHT